jgi:pimeloyl-ACP methyl ester carboxylesterase
MERHEFAGADGLKLVADVGGAHDAPGVVLLHGGGQTRHSWKRGAERLVEAGYRVISLDARGHGESDWAPDGDYAMPRGADDLRAVAAALPAPPALVGASMGGLTAIGAMGTAPELVAPALVLVDVTPRVSRAGAQRVVDFMRAQPEGFASLEAAADAVAAYNPDRPRPKTVDGLRRNLRERDGRWHWHWDPRMMSGEIDPSALDAYMLAAAEMITAPTLLVRGDKSDVVGPEEIAEFRAVMPHAEYVDVAGAGHMVAGDRNDAFNDAIVAFLRRTYPTTGRSGSAARP